MSHSRSSGSLARSRNPQLPPAAQGGAADGAVISNSVGMASSSSLSCLQPSLGGSSASHVGRKAYSVGQPQPRWAPPVSHHPGKHQPPPPPLLATWSEAAGEHREPRVPMRQSAKERSLQRTEAALNDRLASASATLQSYKMATLDVAEGSQPTQPAAGFITRSPTKSKRRGDDGAGASPSASGVAHAPRTDAKLALKGEKVPTSNERLGLILSDLMR